MWYESLIKAPKKFTPHVLLKLISHTHTHSISNALHKLSPPLSLSHTHTLEMTNEPNSVAMATPSPDSETVDSDFVVILATLLCALICVLGLIAVARCGWIRRLSGQLTGTSSSISANKGLKKKTLKSFPMLTFSDIDNQCNSFSDCAICLADFLNGDELRVLPKCGHAFHLSCVDTWLGSHSTCPSCRQILVVSTTGECKKCSPENQDPVVVAEEVQSQRQLISSFLP